MKLLTSFLTVLTALSFPLSAAVTFLPIALDADISAFGFAGSPPVPLDAFNFLAVAVSTERTCFCEVVLDSLDSFFGILAPSLTIAPVNPVNG